MAAPAVAIETARHVSVVTIPPRHEQAMISLHRRHPEAYRRQLGRYLIEIKLRDIRELFNTLDPAPFPKKDLNPAAEEYLVSAVREIGPHPSALLLHVPAGTPGAASDELIAAVRHYFTYRAWHTREQLRALLWRGFISLMIGLSFLVACLWVRQALEGFAGGARKSFMSEGLLILGWVAMWRPVEIFLYDWWPEFGKRRLYLRIARMTIELEPGRAESDRPQALRNARTSDDFTAAGTASAAGGPA
jgi:hypothetical protein